MLNTIFSAFLQLLIFSLIPFIVYLIKKKRASGFFEYIGLKKSNARANLYAVLLVLFSVTPLVLLILLNKEFQMIMTNPQSVSGALKHNGNSIETVIMILITAVFKTAMAEEIIFRGFLAKRLIAISNFQIGNWVHSIIFGFLHAFLFYQVTTNSLFLLVIFLFPTITSYFKVYLNEKLADGSIIPGWIAHSLANIISYSLVVFYL